MDLRTLKKEVSSLGSMKDLYHNFQQCWLKPLRANNQDLFPFLQELSLLDQKKLNQELVKFKEESSFVESAEILRSKLNFFVRNLIELKLTQLKGDSQKAKMITANLLEDEFLNLKQALREVEIIERQLKLLIKHYHEINDFLQTKLSLENSLFFLSLPHQRYLYQMQKITDEKKNFLKSIGHNFVKLARKKKLN